MYMDEQQVIKPHRITLQNRSSLQVAGVSDVIAYDPGEIILETSAGLLLIKGSELHMNHLSLEKGETGVDGRVDSLTYSETNSSAPSILASTAVHVRQAIFWDDCLSNGESGCIVSGKTVFLCCFFGRHPSAGL